MPVPVGDSVCRFIRKTDWSTELDKPKARAFKQNAMSVWHEGRLQAKGAVLDDLKIGELAGSGQLSLTVDDYLDIARKVSVRTKETFQIQVEWRSEDEYVAEAWRLWRDAHAQVETIEETPPPKLFPSAFRELLIIQAQRKQAIIPPNLESDDS